MRYVGVTISLLAIGSLGACASVDVKRVTSHDQPGIRYWRPAPYLALQEVNDGKTTTCQVKQIMLPDKSEEYAITLNAGVGTVKANPQLQDGWNLTGMDTNVDSKTSENITAVSGLIKTLIPNGLEGLHAGGSVVKSSGRKCEGLYRVVYDEAGHFSRLVAVPFPPI